MNVGLRLVLICVLVYLGTVDLYHGQQMGLLHFGVAAWLAVGLCRYVDHETRPVKKPKKGGRL